MRSRSGARHTKQGYRRARSVRSGVRTSSKSFVSYAKAKAVPRSPLAKGNARFPTSDLCGSSPPKAETLPAKAASVPRSSRPLRSAPRARTLEPFLVPKLRNAFADFPNLHYSISPEAFHLGDLMRISVRLRSKAFSGSLGFSRTVRRAPNAPKVGTLFRCVASRLFSARSDSEAIDAR